MGKISIVGLGPGDYSLISQGALELLQSSDRIFLLWHLESYCQATWLTEGFFRKSEK